MLLVEITLDGKGYSAKSHPAAVTGMVDMSTKGSKKPKDTPLALGMEKVVELLQANCTARVVVIVSTHCMDDTGMFVWGGTREESSVCTLHHVCIGRSIFQLLCTDALLRCCLPASPQSSGSSYPVRQRSPTPIARLS